MAVNCDSASSQYLEIASALVTAAPFSFGCLFRPNSVGIAGTLFSIATSGSGNNHFKLDIAAAGILRFRARTTGSSDALTSGAVTAGDWFFGGCRAVSATDRSVFLDLEKANSTTSRVPAGMNRTSIGRSAESAGTSYLDAAVAYAGLWGVALSDADFAQLARGTHPRRVRPDGLIEVWELRGDSPGIGSVGRNELTVVGATKADNPRIFMP